MVRLSLHTPKTESTVKAATHSNPFSVSFKNSISPDFQMLKKDIFERQHVESNVKNTSLLNKISVISAKMNNKFKGISFNGVRNNMETMSNKAKTSFSGLVSKISSLFRKENKVEELKTQPVAALKEMLTNAVSSRAAQSM